MNSQNLSPEEDMAIFTHEAEQGNYRHALFHLACAISSDSECEEWLLEADKIWYKLEEEVFQYFKNDNKEQYYAVIALHSYYLWKAGYAESAFSELIDVISVVPNAYYFPWLAKWLFSIKDTSILPPILIYRITSCINQLDYYANNNGEQIYEKLLEFLENIQEQTENKFLMTSMLYRRLKRYEEALTIAKEGFAKFPTANNANFVALCYRDMGKLDEMEEYTKISISINPSERSICNDMGDAFLENKNFKKAAQYYALVMEVSSDEWAEPSYYYSRYMLGGEEANFMLDKLLDYVEKHEDNSRASDLFDKVYNTLCPEDKLFYKEIPYSLEALTNLFRRISIENVEKNKSNLHSLTSPSSTSPSIRTTLTCLESPSSVNVFKLYLTDYGKNPANFELICNKEPDPPFLEPVNEPGVTGEFRLWNYDEKYRFTPNVEQPNKKVKDIVLDLGTTSYDLREWYEKAIELSKKLTSEDRKSLEGVMVFPPELPVTDYPMDEWLMRVQYAAVFLLAALDEKENLIPSPSLKKIMFGQLDWPVLAALTVLSYQTQLHEECSQEVYNLFTDFISRIFKDSECFFLTTYLVSILHINGLSDKEKDFFKNHLLSILSEEED